ncbi:hypothetical protein D9613_005100 [Agrocybe pediades]|uniref:CCHC-type domain-containing protein n=1 Tax=Agrocybe pediades TaxID=84607 RepID=A0A8H4QZ20_9AGAR|nr:hypothetical protein D9613_005100 [Agrocybe pediades]
MSSREVIDLTTPPSSPPPHPSNSTTTDAVSEVPPAVQARRKRKRRSKKSLASTSTATSLSSVRNSPEPHDDSGSSKRQRIGDVSAHDTAPNATETREAINSESGGFEDAGSMFFIDIAPAPIPSTQLAINEKKADEINGAPSKLLVPAHVTVLGSTPVEIIPPDLSSDSDDEDFIEYFEAYDHTKHTQRYFHEPTDEPAPPTWTVCKNCGAEAQHKTSACPVQVCLTCGARDEHSTRSCPISKVCFTCGMKGHINSTCPNRASARALRATQDSECDRCSSSRHKTNECPTLWRLYEYLTNEEQTRILTLRQARKDFQLGQGGEGYVANDIWCYYCGSYGHWGDECEDNERDNFAEEFSAFSIFNVMNGPFYDPEKESHTSTARPRREQEDLGTWGVSAPSDVGRQGRIKSRAAMAKQAQQSEEDQEDWFANSSKRSSNSNRQKQETKKISFGKSFNDSKQHESTSNHYQKPSLLDRIQHFATNDTTSYQSSRREHHHSSSNRSRSDRHRRDERDRYSSDRRRQGDSGPRYKGGYAR